LQSTHSPCIEVSRPQFLGGGTWQLSRLSPITVILGKNGSGKSALLRAIQSLDLDSYHYIAPERAGETSPHAEFTQRQADGRGRAEANSYNSAREHRRAVASRIGTYFQARGKFDGDVIPVRPSELEHHLDRLFPEFEIHITRNMKLLEVMHFGKLKIGSGIDNDGNILFSSGELGSLFLALDVLTISAIWELEGNSKRVILLDEPDVHLHPDLQQRLAEFLVNVSESFSVQFLIATHSTALLAACGHYGGSDASTIYLSRDEHVFVAQPFNSYQQQLANILGGHALMGSLFAAPLLLVEGVDDYQVWSQVPRYRKLNIAAIPCNGDEIFKNQQALESLFSCLGENPTKPVGYALVDGDKKIPRGRKAPLQNFIPFLQMACREAENLYLTDEVLSEFEVTWPQAQEKIMAKAHDFAEDKAEILMRLATLPSEERISTDLKDVMLQVRLILDPTPLTWQMRLGKYLGTHEPSGQIRAFLGEQVVGALWRVSDQAP
jgi:energy-coupling factor transporter ATP-binding protein EcfA2